MRFFKIHLLLAFVAYIFSFLSNFVLKKFGRFEDMSPIAALATGGFLGVIGVIIGSVIFYLVIMIKGKCI